MSPKNKCKPCNPCGNTNAGRQADEYLMVKATASEAATCGLPGSASGTEDCDKQEPMYDSITSSFLVPVDSENTNITVCNASIYSVGQWLQFSNPSVTMRITGINANVITVSGVCEDGEPVDNNPSPGQAVSSGSIFSVVGRPRCAGSEQLLQEIEEALATAEQLCVPAMVESSNVADIQVVGRVESDPSNLSFGRCIRRVYGFLMRAGTPIFSAIQANPSSARASYRRLGISKTSREVKELPNLSEEPGLLANSQYALGYNNTNEYSVGPSHIPCLFDLFLYELGNMDNNIYSTVPPAYEHTINLSTFSEVTSIKRSQDHYWANLHLIVAHRSNSFIYVYVNDNLIIRVFNQTSDGPHPSGSIVIPIRVTNSNQNIKITFKKVLGSTGASWQLSYKVALKGIFV